MSFKFTKPVEEYANHITIHDLKRAFEEYGFEVELKDEYTFDTKTEVPNHGYKLSHRTDHI